MAAAGNPKKGRRFSGTTLQDKITDDYTCEVTKLIDAAALWFGLKISVIQT